MPMFDYECLECGIHTELIVSSGERDDQICEKCGSDLTRVCVSRGTRFILNGSGWFRDGYSDQKTSKGDSDDT